MSDPSFSREHRARFLDLRKDGELSALNGSDEHLDFGPWHLRCDLGDSDTANRLKARFRAAVQKAALFGGAPYRVNRLDWWVSKLVHGRPLAFIHGLIQRSAEYCEELETRSLELGAAPTKPDCVGGLYRDRYPCDWGEPYMLYDGPPRLFSEPKAEFEYWTEHIWGGFNEDIAKLNQMHGPPKRQEEEARQAYWVRVKQRVDFRYAVVKKTVRGLSYDLAVLQANYIIDRGLRGDAGIRAFQDESADLIESVRTFWRESSKRLGLSYRKQEKQVVAVAGPFRAVGEDLRHLTSAMPAEAGLGSGGLETAEDPAKPALMAGTPAALVIWRQQQQDIAVQEALGRLGRQPGWAQAQIQLTQADEDWARSMASGSGSPWQVGVSYYKALAGAWLGLVTDSQSARDFYTILPVIVDGVYQQCFQGATPETFRPASAEAHQFQTDLTLVDRDFRKRAAQQALTGAGMPASTKDNDDSSVRVNDSASRSKQPTLEGESPQSASGPQAVSQRSGRPPREGPGSGARDLNDLLPDSDPPSSSPIHDATEMARKAARAIDIEQIAAVLGSINLGQQESFALAPEQVKGAEALARDYDETQRIAAKSLAAITSNFRTEAPPENPATPAAAISQEHSESRPPKKPIRRRIFKPAQSKEARAAKQAAKERAVRAKTRSEWLDRKLIEKSWTADTEIPANGGPSYNTIQRYRSGKQSTRERYVRLELSKVFGCEVSAGPE